MPLWVFSVLDPQHPRSSTLIALQAAKAASLELTNLRQFLRLQQGAKGTARLSLPLSLLADYGGYRIVASALLPISGSTLVYGSAGKPFKDASDVVLIPFVACADAGSTIHDSDDEAARLMGAAAATINIKPHIVGSGANARLLYGPCDIEIHRGVDRRLYVVDVARLLPPEPPGGALAAFLVHASTDSAAATTKHMTPIDLSRKNAEAEIAKVLSTASVLGVDAMSNVTPNPGLLSIAIPGATVFMRLDANPHRVVSAGISPTTALTKYDLASLAAVFGRNVAAEAFLAASELGGKEIGLPLFGDAVIVAGERGQHLFHCLRPEFVRHWRAPLSSDAFTRFGIHDAAVHNAEVLDAARALQNSNLPALAARLNHLERPILHPSAVVEEVS